ncbi:FCD domain-containing protein [Rugosimonospora acidiphila]|uniref:FCD domain-containing protein n=1 Tax=Rugosimonospora acidiphila TaxID=556531 RepID=A0ABP9S3S5_9ACTN
MSFGEAVSVEQLHITGASRPSAAGDVSRPPKAAMLVAQRIVRDVVRGRMTPGDLLPPERVMLETYSTGRGTLREALRLLEFQGVISLKPGPGGGPVLQAPAASHLASTLVLLMQLNRAPYRVIVEVRTVLEPTISQLAAKQITDGSLAELGATIERMRDDVNDRDSFRDANRQFHDIIAWSSGNVLFAYIVDSLLGILDGTVIGIDYPSQRRAAIVKAHEEIYEALARRDESASEQRMREHLEAYTRYAKKKFPEVFEQTITWDGLIG